MLTIFVQGLDALIVLDLTREHVHIMEKKNSVWRKKIQRNNVKSVQKLFPHMIVFHIITNMHARYFQSVKLVTNILENLLDINVDFFIVVCAIHFTNQTIRLVLLGQIFVSRKMNQIISFLI